MDIDALKTTRNSGCDQYAESFAITILTEKKSSESQKKNFLFPRRILLDLFFIQIDHLFTTTSCSLPNNPRLAGYNSFDFIA